MVCWSPTGKQRVSVSTAQPPWGQPGFSLQVSTLGRGSFTLDIEGSHKGVSCVTARLTMVWVSLGERLQSSPVPIDIRQLMSAYIVAPDEMEPSK